MEEGVSVSATEWDSLPCEDQTRSPSPAPVVDNLQLPADDEQTSGSPEMLVEETVVSIPMQTNTNSDVTADELENLDEFGTDSVEEEIDNDSREPLNPELTQGYRILKEIMSDANKSVNWPFMEPVDAEKLGLYDYHERVKKPMWLKRIREKFEDREYETITEFVRDMRQMLENCYRYNGPDHYVSKRGQKLETVLEQKLTLLSREMREKTTIAATSGQPVEEKMITGTRRRKVLVPNDSSVLLNQLRYEEQQRKKEERLQQIEDRRRAQEAFLADLDSWEDALFPDGLRQEMKSMWEIPQIGLFLFVCGSVLNLGEVMHWELERSFALPRQSSTMQLIMTALLSTPYQRTKLDKKPLMPYSVWEERLRIRVRTWYKVLTENKGNIGKTAAKLGLEEQFFKVMGRTNPLEQQRYHQLTFYQRVWVMKSLCDWCLEQQESIREAIEQQPIQELQSYPLGSDGDGNTYIHFPQFCGQDLRIYRQAPFKYPQLDIDKPKLPDTPHSKSRSRRSPKKKSRTPAAKPRVSTPVEEPVARARDSRLRQKPRQVSRVDEPEDDGSASDGSTTSSSFSGSDCESEEPPEKLSRLNIPDCPSPIDIPNRALRSARLKASLGSAASLSPLDRSPNPRSRSGSRSRSNTPSKRTRRRLASPSRNAAGDGSGDGPPEADAKDGHQGVQEDGAEGADNVASKSGGGDEKEGEGSSMGGENSSADTTDAMDVDKPQTQPSSPVADSSVQDEVMDDAENEPAPTASNGLDADQPRNDNCKTEPKTESVDSCGIYKNSPGSGLSESQPFCDKPVPVRSPCPAGPALVNGHDTTCDTDATQTEAASCKCKENTDVGGDDNAGCSCCRRSPQTDDSRPSPHSAESEAKVSSDIKSETEPSDIKQEPPGDPAGQDVSGEVKPCDREVTNGCVKSEPGAAMDTEPHPVVKQEPGEPLATDSQQSATGKVKIEPCTDTKSEPCADIKSEPCTAVEPKLSTYIKPVLPTDIKSEPCTDIKPASSDALTEPSADSSNKPLDDVKPPVDEKPIVNGSASEVLPEPPEIIAPDLEEFSLVADCVEDLRRLLERFAEPEPVKETTRGNKQKVLRTAQRKRCEVDLHKRLEFLYGELEPWEPKLIAANKRARLKLRKEQENYCDEPEPKENVWDSEESASEDSDEDSGEDSDAKSSKKPVVSAATSRDTCHAPVMSNSAESEVEIIEDLSQRGRLRKRRLIPNTEITGPVRKQIKTETEEKNEKKSFPELTRTVTPSILQTSRRPGTVTAVGGVQRLAAGDSASATVAASSLLAGRQTLLMGSGQQPILLRLPSGQQVQLMAQRPDSRTNAPRLLPNQTPVLAIKDPNGGPPQLLTFVNPLKHQISLGKTQPAASTKLPVSSSAGVTSTSNSIVSVSKSVVVSSASPTQLKCAVTSVSSAPVVASSAGSTVVNSVASVEPTRTVQYYNNSAVPQLPAKERQTMLDQHGVTLNGWLALQRRQRTQNLAAAEEEMASGGSGADSSAAEEECNMDTTEGDAPQQPEAALSSVKSGDDDARASGGQPSGDVPVTTVAGLPVKLAQLIKKHGANILNGQSLQDLLASQSGLLTSPTKPKYAGNITVKSLLEHRAALLKEPAIVNVVHSAEPASTSAGTDITTAVVSQSSSAAPTVQAGSSNEPPLPPPPPASLHPVGSLSVNVLPAATPGTSIVKKVSISEDRLNSLVQSVITEAPTTLPTAQFKVESPFGMPLLQSHRPVTMTTSSMKSPIPSVPPIDDKTSSGPAAAASAAAPVVSSEPIHHVAPTSVVLPSGVPQVVASLPGTGVPRLVLPPAALQALLAQQKARAVSQPLLGQQPAVQVQSLAMQGAVHPPASGPSAMSQAAASKLVMVPGSAQLQSAAAPALANMVQVPAMHSSSAGLVTASQTVMSVAAPVHSLPVAPAGSVAVTLAGAAALTGMARPSVGGNKGVPGTAGPVVAGNTVLAQQLIQSLMSNQSSAAGLLVQNMVMQQGQPGVQLLQIPAAMPPEASSSVPAISVVSKPSPAVSTPSMVSSAVPAGALDLLSNAALGLTSPSSLTAEPSTVHTLHSLDRVQTAGYASQMPALTSTRTVPQPHVISTRTVSQTPATPMTRTDSPLQANVAAPVLSPVAGSSGGQKGSVHVLQLTGVGGKPLQVQVSAPAGVSLQQLLRSPQLQKKLAMLTGISGSKTFKVAAPAAAGAPGVATQPTAPAPAAQPLVNSVTVNTGLRLSPAASLPQTGSVQAQPVKLPSAPMSVGQLAADLGAVGAGSAHPPVVPAEPTQPIGPNIVTLGPSHPLVSDQAVVVTQPSVGPAVVASVPAPGIQPSSSLSPSPVKPAPIAMPAVQLMTKPTPMAIPAVQIATKPTPAVIPPIQPAPRVTRVVPLAATPAADPPPLPAPIVTPTVQQSLSPTPTTMQPSASPAPTASAQSNPKPAGQVSPAARKLVLYNINGQLMTSQGVPVSVVGGVVKVSTKATAEVIASNLLALRQANIVSNPSVTSPPAGSQMSVSAGPVAGMNSSAGNSQPQAVCRPADS